MQFNTYDVLSSLIHGVVVTGFALTLYDITFTDYSTLFFLSISFCVGYLINGIGSWCQDWLFWLMGGKPTERILTKKEGCSYSGTNHIRFYFSAEILDMLKSELNESDASISKYAARMCQHFVLDENSRIKDFNASYAFARSLIITTTLIAGMVLSVYYDKFIAYFVLALPILCFFRCKDRAFHYAKEVATQYYHKVKSQS